MKQSAVCPKCSGQQILRVPSSGGDGDNFIVHGWSIFTYIPVTRYICASCGYSEDWIDSSEDLQRLVKKYGTSTEAG